jgi:PKD domain
MLSSGRPRSDSPRKRVRRRGLAVWPRVSVLEGRVLPATFTVNSFLDTPDAKPGDGQAFDAAGRITLRAAVMEANALPGADQINLPSGTFTLTLAGANEDFGATGDLDVLNGNLTVVGADASLTHVDANQLDRLFDVQPNAGLSIYGVSLTGGRANDGAGVRVGSGATLILDTDILRGNATSSGAGGAVLVAGGLLDSTSTFFDSNISAAEGGGVAVLGGSATILGAAFLNNSASSGGGLSVLGGSATATYSTFSGNKATAGGGAIGMVPAGAGAATTVTVQGSTVTANSAAIAGGLLSTGGFAVFDSIVAGNTGGGAPDVSGTFTDQGHNLIGDATGATGFTVSTLVGNSGAPIDPKLSGLDLHNGATPNYVPYPGSPALDAGDTTGLASTDQRGLPRLQGAAPDIGAVESRTFTLTNLSAGAHATVGSVFNPPLQVQLKEGPTGLGGVPVIFTAPQTGPGGSFAGTGTALTDNSGNAVAPTYTANFTAGSYSIRATVGGALGANLPVANDALTGVSTLVTIDNPQSQTTAGNPVQVTITVRTPAGQPIPNFSGSVTISTNDPLGDAPVVVSFSGSSPSTTTVPITLRQSGSHTITAKLDAANGGGSTTSTINVAPSAASSLILQAPAQVDAGSPFAITILARDQFGNLATAYTGPVTLTSSDPQAALPDVAFSPGTGMATVSGVILRSAGSQSLQVTDASGGFQGGTTLNVVPPGVTLNPVAGNEGSPITLDGSLPAGTTSGSSTVTIDWGDGTAPTTLPLAAGANNFSTNHTYAASSTAGYPISVLVADAGGGVFSGSETAQVANVPPTVTVSQRNVVLTQDQTFTSTGGFNDPGNDISSATVNYGDGTGDQPLTLNPDKSFNLQHSYSTEGTFNVVITIRDKDGGVSVVQQRAAVFLAGTTGLVVQQVPAGATATIVADGVTVVYTNNSPNVTATVVLGRVDPAALAALGVLPGTTDAYDVRVLDGDPRSLLLSTFHFTDTTGRGVAVLATFDPTVGRFVLVQGSRQFPGAFVIDKTADTVTVLIDQTSRPTLTSLGGTLFTLSVPGEVGTTFPSAVRTDTRSFETPASGQTLVAADSGGGVRQGSTTNLVSSSSLTLTLAASEGLRRGGFDDEPRRLPLDVRTVKTVYDTVTDITNLLLEAVRMFIDVPAPMVAPMDVAPENPVPPAADQVRIDDLAPAAPARAVLAEPPIVIDMPADVFAAPRQNFSEAIRFAHRAEPADDFTHDPIRARISDEPSDDERFAALMTGLWVGGTALYASAPEVWVGARPAQRPRWKPRKMEDVSKN